VESLLPASWRTRLESDLQGTFPGSVSTRSVRAALKRVIPSAWVGAIRARLGPEQPSLRLLTLRAALASRMVRLLEADAKAMGGSRR
jgi:hypothetical protein